MRKRSLLLKLLSLGVALLQFILLTAVFWSQPEHTNTSHISPHLAVNQKQQHEGHESLSSKPQLMKVDDTNPSEDQRKVRPRMTFIEKNFQIQKDDIHQHDFHLDGQVDTKDNWQHLEGLPDWVKEYFAWHHQQTKILNENNWHDFNYLVVQCMKEDDHCGGTSDRLKPIPLLLLMAYRYKRIFLIHWTRPFRLEEFLVPNAINWTVPEYLPLTDVEENGKIVAKATNIEMYSAKSTIRFVRTKLQSFDGGLTVYENTTDSTYAEIYHDLFRLLFDPAPPIARTLKQEMNDAGLVQGEYAVAHYRAFYGRSSRRPTSIAKFAINAVNCASQLRPGGPVYFASDSLYAIGTVRNYSKEHGYKIVTIENQEPLHLDKDDLETERQPSDYYSIFVDLYLMGMGHCFSYGQGGFGRYALLLSYNATCSRRHTWNTKLLPCEWAS